MGPELLTLGEPMLEFSELPSSEDGKKLYLQGYGGDSSNAAVAAARQGARVGTMTGLGRDAPGDAFLALWRAEGVDTTGVKRDPVHPTGVYFITHDAGGHRFFYLRKETAAAHFGPADLPRDLVAGARILLASGISLAISPAAADAVFAAIDIVRGAGGRVAIDTNYRPLLWPPARAAAEIHAAIAKSDIALVSEEDARALTGHETPGAILDFYCGLGPAIVVLKRGKEGAILATEARRIGLPAPTVPAVDATGAGDVFAGAFLARLLDGDGADEAARHAVVAAALSTMGYGAVAPIPRASQVRAALAGQA
ncbi:MAG: sugar kinase [Acetobacteraceae bacterium]